MEQKTKLVHFGEYCPKCKDKDTKETDDPCNECLTYPTNLDSHKPVNFKEEK